MMSAQSDPSSFQGVLPSALAEAVVGVAALQDDHHQQFGDVHVHAVAAPAPIDHQQFGGDHHHQHSYGGDEEEEDPADAEAEAAAVAVAVAAAAEGVKHEQSDRGEDGGGTCEPVPNKKRRRKLLLTFHEALTFASRGVYVDIETGQLRCSCNHKPCDKWDMHGYTRHFGFKVHKKYEEERLDDAEIARLREAKATYLRMHPQVEEQSIRKKRKMREGEKLLSVDELRVQERHWMEMWKDAKNELRQLRQDLKGEADEEVRAELIADIEGLKKRKGDWGRLLGLNETIADVPVTF